MENKLIGIIKTEDHRNINVYYNDSILCSFENIKTMESFYIFFVKERVKIMIQSLSEITEDLFLHFKYTKSDYNNFKEWHKTFSIAEQPGI